MEIDLLVTPKIAYTTSYFIHQNWINFQLYRAQNFASMSTDNRFVIEEFLIRMVKPDILNVGDNIMRHVLIH